MQSGGSCSVSSMRRTLIVLVVGSFTMFGCSSSNKSVESATTVSEVATQSTQKASKTIEVATDDVIRTFGRLLDPAPNNWNCEGDYPGRESPTYNLMKALTTSCVWSEVPGVVKVMFKCFVGTATNPDKQAVCKTLLNQMSERLSIFSLAEAATMPELSALDGLQTASTGVSTWKFVPGDGMLIVVDVAKREEIIAG